MGEKNHSGVIFVRIIGLIGLLIGVCLVMYATNTIYGGESLAKAGGLMIIIGIALILGGKKFFSPI